MQDFAIIKKTITLKSTGYSRWIMASYAHGRKERKNNHTETMKMKKKDEARIAYDASVEDCENLLEMLKYAIRNHAHDSRMEGVHWEHLGDMNHLRQQLMETLMSLNLDADTDEAEYLKDLDAELKEKRKA